MVHLNQYLFFFFVFLNLYFNFIGQDSHDSSLPKTFVLVKDKYEYFKPKIQYETDIIDKHDHITELFIRFVFL